MNLFIQFLVVFDLICFGLYFGGDILVTVLNKIRKKPAQKEPFDFSAEDGPSPRLSIDSIRQLYSDDVAAFVEATLLPDAAKTMETLDGREQMAVRLLLCALVGYLKEEAPMDEQSFPMVMELLDNMNGGKEDGEVDAVDILLEDAARHTSWCKEYYSDYQRYRLMRVDKGRVILACQVIVNHLLGKLYRFDYRFGYNLLLDEENSVKGKLHTPVREGWEVEEDAPGDR